MDGHGQLSFDQGELYVGHFSANKFDGEGKYQWRDGRIYLGGWKLGKQHGKGKIFIGRKVYIGLWIKGVRNDNWLDEYEETEVDLTLRSDSKTNTLQDMIIQLSRSVSLKSNESGV